MFSRLRGILVRVFVANASKAEREIAAKHWGIPLTASAPPVKPRESLVGNSSPPKEPKASDVETPVGNEALPAKQQTDPVFGLLLQDLGYKRVYLSSVDLLKRLPIWEKQRAYRHERALDIAKEKEASANLRGTKVSAGQFPGVITLFDRPSRDLISRSSAGILDGQHRRGALSILCSKGLMDSSLFDVLTEVFTLSSDPDDARGQAKTLFLEINKAQPVKAVDLPDLGADSQEAAILFKVMESLERDYGAFFSQSSSPRPPNLNGDSFRNAMFSSGLLKKSKAKDAQELLDWIRKANRKLSKLSKEEWKDRWPGRLGPAFEKALSKARNHQFFIGMDSRWMTGE